MQNLLSKKFTLSSTDFSRLNVNNKLYLNPFFHIIVTYGDGVKIYNEGK